MSNHEDYARREVLEHDQALLFGVESLARDNPTETPLAQTEPARTEATDWPDPEPLGGQLPAVDEFEPDLLPDALRPLCEDVSYRMGVPLDYAAVAAVLCLAGVVGRRAVIQPKKRDTGWRVIPNLWGGVIGSPEMKKSPLIIDITTPLHRIEQEWAAQFAEAMSEYGWRKEEADLKKQAWRESYKARIKDNKPAPERPAIELEEPKRRRLIVNDCTPEALHKILSENPSGILLIRDELTGWLAQLEKPGHEGERQYYLESWGGNQSYSADRIERGHIAAPALCMSVLGGIQPSRFRSYLTDALRDGPANDGLVQRFQVIVYPDSPTQAVYVDRPPDQEAISKAEKLFRTLAALDSDNPLLLCFSEDAQAMFVEWFTLLENQLLNDSVHPALTGHLAKYRSLMPSLAGLFALADGEREQIPLRHAQKAADWCEYLESHARRIYGMIISPEWAAASELGNRLREGWRRNEGFFSLRDVYRNGWSRLTTPADVRAALPFLEDAGWIRERHRDVARGRPTEIYDINPRIDRGEEQ